MSQPHHSLLSLSFAAANAAPIPPSTVAEQPARSPQATTTKHRRLSSAGRSRRRLSDARDAATRPFPTSLQSASVSLAALSLSSPTVSHRTVNGAQPIQVPRATSTKPSEADPADVDEHLSVSPPHSRAPLSPVSISKSGRKRGTIFTCESCSKVYRHPSCLIKHRWEHTPQWREASKFVLSKHQQVQLLEAAAILSHLSPSSASLPEDRSLWPSFLSGGLVPPPVNNDATTTTASTVSTTSPAPSTVSSSVHTSFPMSSSVPASSVVDASVTAPRLHDYAVSVDDITHVRPGMLGVSNDGERSGTNTTDAMNLLALRSGSVTSDRVVTRSHARSYSYSHTRTHSVSRERRRSNAYEYVQLGVSIPRSSVRSHTGSSRSRSQSVSVSVSEGRSEEEEEGEELAGEVDGDMDGVGWNKVYGHAWDGNGKEGRSEETWDGMEMEMEMD